MVRQHDNLKPYDSYTDTRGRNVASRTWNEKPKESEPRTLKVEPGLAA